MPKITEITASVIIIFSLFVIKALLLILFYLRKSVKQGQGYVNILFLRHPNPHADLFCPFNRVYLNLLNMFEIRNYNQL